MVLWFILVKRCDKIEKYINKENLMIICLIILMKYIYIYL